MQVILRKTGGGRDSSRQRASLERASRHGDAHRVNAEALDLPCYTEDWAWQLPDIPACEHTSWCVTPWKMGSFKEFYISVLGTHSVPRWRWVRGSLHPDRAGQPTEGMPISIPGSLSLWDTCVQPWNFSSYARLRLGVKGGSSHQAVVGRGRPAWSGAAEVGGSGWGGASGTMCELILWAWELALLSTGCHLQNTNSIIKLLSTSI